MIKAMFALLHISKQCAIAWSQQRFSVNGWVHKPIFVQTPHERIDSSFQFSW